VRALRDGDIDAFRWRVGARQPHNLGAAQAQGLDGAVVRGRIMRRTTASGSSSRASTWPRVGRKVWTTARTRAWREATPAPPPPGAATAPTLRPVRYGREGGERLPVFGVEEENIERCAFARRSGSWTERSAPAGAVWRRWLLTSPVPFHILHALGRKVAFPLIYRTTRGSILVTKR
jgi:hypothetical protein